MLLIIIAVQCPSKHSILSLRRVQNLGKDLLPYRNKAGINTVTLYDLYHDTDLFKQLFKSADRGSKSTTDIPCPSVEPTQMSQGYLRTP